MILSFKKQFPWGKPTNFENKILSGVKIHTIREDEKERWKAGVKVHADTGVRTKNQKRIMEDVCRSVQPIQIVYSKPYGDYNLKDVAIFIDGKNRGTYRKWSQSGFYLLEDLAKNDGFDSVEDFFKWFNTDFQGKIIHWASFRY